VWDNLPSFQGALNLAFSGQGESQATRCPPGTGAGGQGSAAGSGAPGHLDRDKQPSPDAQGARRCGRGPQAPGTGARGPSLQPAPFCLAVSPEAYCAFGDSKTPGAEVGAITDTGATGVKYCLRPGGTSYDFQYTVQTCNRLFPHKSQRSHSIFPRHY
jgi:hypothetical protein